MKNVELDQKARKQHDRHPSLMIVGEQMSFSVVFRNFQILEAKGMLPTSHVHSSPTAISIPAERQRSGDGATR
jgi:hypothetical protein